MPVFFANFQEKFRDLVLGWYFIVTFGGTNLTEIHQMTGLSMHLLYELKLKFEATIVEAKRIVSKLKYKYLDFNVSIFLVTYRFAAFWQNGN